MIFRISLTFDYNIERLILMYYMNFIVFLKNPDKTWNDILVRETTKAKLNLKLFDYCGLTFEKKNPEARFK